MVSGKLDLKVEPYGGLALMLVLMLVNMLEKKLQFLQNLLMENIMMQLL